MLRDLLRGEGVSIGRDRVTGLSRDRGDHTASPMTGSSWKPAHTAEVPCKDHHEPTNLSRRPPGRLYRFRPYPPILWTVPCPGFCPYYETDY
jgi:hypothetical protein